MTQHPSDQLDLRNAAVTAIKDQESKTKPLGPNDKRVPFPSALSGIMTRAQEDAMMDFVKRRFYELDNELGRSATDTSNAQTGREWYLGPELSGHVQQDYDRMANSFFGKRLIYEMTYQNKMEWRKSIPGSVFKDCNLTLSSSRRITNQRNARFRKYFLDSRPWFAVQPVSPRTDKEFAQKLMKIADIKLLNSGSEGAFGQAITTAGVINEAIVHIKQAVDDDHYIEEVECLVDTQGLPIVAGDGDYILRDDIWLPAPQFDPVNMAGESMTVSEDLDHTVLQRDPSTSKTTDQASGTVTVTTPDGDFTASHYANSVVTRRTVNYEGARSEVLYHRDFLCPIGASDIQKADCIFHLDRIPASAIAQQYAANPSADTIRQAVDLLNNARHNTSEAPQAPAAGKPRTSIGERPGDFRPVSDDMNIGHCYWRGDPAGTGITSDIYVMVDIDTWTPIYYHHTAACSPTRQRPYRVVRSTEVEGRWFGQGDMEKFANASMVIDLFLCRAVISQSRAGRITGFRPERCEEGKKNRNLKINFGDTITPIGDHKLADVVEVLYLEDNKSQSLHETLQLLNQAATNESGTATANDAQMAGLENQETATGQNLIRQAGDELTSLPISQLRVGLTLALSDFIDTTFRFHNHAETFMILENQVPIELKLEHPDTKNLRTNVTILLTNLYDEQRRSSRQAAIGLANQYYDIGMTDPARMVTLQGLYVDAIQAFGIENAQDYIVPRGTPAVDPATGQPIPGAVGVTAGPVGAPSPGAPGPQTAPPPISAVPSSDQPPASAAA